MNRSTVALWMFCSTATAADLRPEALQAIFPGMDVVETTRHHPDSKQTGTLTYPDAFANETIYQVNGPATNEIERCASEDMPKGQFSKSREVQLQVLPWPRTRADLLAVVQYRFIGAAPAGACWSIGLLVHLSRRGPGYEVLERHLVEPMHHSLFAGVRLVDVNGDGVEELVVEPNMGGAGTIGTSLLVFDLSGRRFRQILQTQSRLEYLTSDRYSQELEVTRSVEQEGRSVCFELTLFAKNDKVYPKPRVSHECYPIGTGVDEKQTALLDDELRPLQAKPRP
jgi:hypothetical protein